MKVAYNYIVNLFTCEDRKVKLR